MKKSLLIQMYLKLPLWGQITLPVVGVFLVISIFKTISWAFYLGLFAIAAYLVASAFLYFKDKKR